MGMKKVALTIVVLLFAPTKERQAQPVCCRGTASDTTEWKTYDEGGFSFRIPPRFEEVEVRSVDSQGGKRRTGDATIFYDFGPYSNPLDPVEQGTFPDLTVCQREDGPDTLRIVVYRHNDTGNVRMGAHWAVLPDGFRGRILLTISGVVPDEHSRSEMLAVIRSVRFPPNAD